MLCLGIESSCDESAAAVVNDERKILSNIVLSQIKEHEAFKGVVPEIASRAHLNYVESAIKRAVQTANTSLDNISCIAATCGPGLIGGLIVGTMFAKSIAASLKKPFIAVNHLEAHALTARLTDGVEFPYLLLLISGGHCEFLIAKNVGSYELLGKTKDDAAGEAFDKVAKMLNLEYPGGPAIEKAAKNGDKDKYILPMPMCDRDGCDLSFAGLKTAVRNIIQNNTSNNNIEFAHDLSASFQHTVLKILQYKINKAIIEYEKQYSSKQIVISGGVAANHYLISNLRSLVEEKGYKLIAPPSSLCTDNAAMVAWTGIEKFTRGQTEPLNYCPKARWSIY